MFLIVYHFIPLDLPYDSVVSFATTSHANLYDVLPFVSMLHIEKPAHFRIGLISKQLRDVKSVSIYNLFHKIDGRPLSCVELDQDMVIKSVPFLSRLTHLENVYFRGVTTKHSFTSLGALSMHQLIDSLSGHFDCGVLSHNLSIRGLSCPKKLARLNAEGEGDCNFCKRVCKNFPLERVFDIDLCLPIDDSKEIIESRHGGKEYLLTDTLFFAAVGKYYCWGNLRRNCYFDISS